MNIASLTAVQPKALRFLSTALLFTMACHLPAAAAELTVFVQTDFEPAKFEGLVTSTNGVITQKVNPGYKEIAPNYYAVTFSIDDNAAEDQTAMAVAIGTQGQMAVGSVIPTSSKTLPQNCSPEALDPITIEVDAGTIRSLAANRLRRREHNRKIFELSFSQFPSSEIEAVERNFGLYYPDHVKRDMNPFQMVDRISRLLAALDSWNFRKTSTLPELGEEEPHGSIPEEGAEPTATHALSTTQTNGSQQSVPAR